MEKWFVMLEVYKCYQFGFPKRTAQWTNGKVLIYTNSSLKKIYLKECLNSFGSTLYIYLLKFT